jgi:hypothetical protein
MSTQPNMPSISTRRNTTPGETSIAAQLGTPVNFEGTDLEDPQAIIQVCSANLTVARDFLLTIKESNSKRQSTLLALDLIQRGLQKILILQAAQPTPLEEIKKIVEQAVAKTLPDKQTAPSYSMIAAKNVTPSATPKITPQVTKYKMLVTPAPNCPGIKTAEDTRRVLTAKPPSDFGIRADKVVIMKNNAVLVESRCASVLKLGESKLLKELKLSAKPMEKSWPRMQIMDIPEQTTQEELLEELGRQNLPETVPDVFTGKMFKYGRGSRNNDRGRSDTTSWVVELHPAARAHFIKTGRVYTTWRSHTIRDFLLVSRCFNCQRFGHIAKFCSAPQQCGYCASTDHESRNCRHREDKRAHKCANCVRSGIKDANHHTAENICPIYQHRAQEAINSTQYDVDG